jgi:hypothetical protein
MTEQVKAFPYTGAGTDGMDLRDYFAAKIMQTFVMSFREDDDWNGFEQAHMAYQIADCMMILRQDRFKVDTTFIEEGWKS